MRTSDGARHRGANRSAARWRRPAATLATVVVLLAAACTEDGPPGDTSTARGAEVYAASCATCHGADLRGTAVGPSMLSELYGPEVHSDEAFRASITGGVAAEHWEFGPMPVVGAVRGSDLDAVLMFVREQQELEGLEPYPPAG